MTEKVNISGTIIILPSSVDDVLIYKASKKGIIKKAFYCFLGTLENRECKVRLKNNRKIVPESNDTNLLAGELIDINIPFLSTDVIKIEVDNTLTADTLEIYAFLMLETGE